MSKKKKPEPIGGAAVTAHLKVADAAALARMTGAGSVSRLLTTSPEAKR